jgi:hypothetical protein
VAPKVSFATFAPSETETVILLSDTTRRLWAKRFDGNRWTDTEGGAALTNDLADTGGVPFDVAR